MTRSPQKYTIRGVTATHLPYLAVVPHKLYTMSRIDGQWSYRSSTSPNAFSVTTTNLLGLIFIYFDWFNFFLKR